MAVYLGSNQVDLLGGDGIPSAYLIPSGTYSISQNGTYDIGSYKSASVELPYYEAYKQIMTSEYIYASSSIFQSYFNTLSYIRIAQFADLKLSGDFNFPEVISMGTNAFGHYGYNNTGSICTFNFPKLQNIPYKAFTYLSTMSKFVAPVCVSIAQTAFSHCSLLSSISFPNCAFIGDEAFVLCDRLTSVNFPNCSYIGSYAFCSCYSLTSISFPNCSYIGSSAFYSCYSLTSAIFFNCSYIGSWAFGSCSHLTSVDFPNCSYIGDYVFEYCYSLTSISFPVCSYIGSYAFFRCYNLLSLYLLGSSIPSLKNINAFNSTPISNYTTSTGGVYGSIYVPASLYNNYLTATNWSVYSSRIVSV